MATEVGSAYVSVYAKVDGSKWASDITSALSGGLSSAKVAVGNILANVASAGITAIRDNLDSAISRVDSLNAFPKVMSNIGFSTDEASAAMSKMSDGIEGLPTALDDIVKNTQSFALSLGDLGKATDVALAVNDGIIAFGGSSYDASNAVKQLNQMISSGTYDMQSWNSINSSAPGFLDAIARSMLGEEASASQLRDALNAGTISSQDFLDALITMDTEGGAGFEAFAKMARDSSGGIATSMANVKTAIVKNLANIIDAFNQDGGIASVFDGIKAAINGVGAVIQPFAEIAGRAFASIAEKAAESLNNFSDRCKTFAGTFRDSMTETDSIAQSVANGLAAAFEGTRFEGAFNTLSAAVGSFCATLNDTGSYTDAFKAALGEMPAPIQAIGEAFLNSGIPEAFSKVVEDVKGRVDTFLFVFTNLKEQTGNIIQSLALALQTAFSGTALSGVFDTFASVIQSFYDKLNEGGGYIEAFKAAIEQIPAPIQLAGAALATLAGASAFAQISTNAGQIAKVIGSTLGGSVRTLVTAVAEAGGGLAGFGSVITSALGGPIGIVIGLVAALAAAFVGLYATNEEFRAQMDAIGAQLMETLQPAFETIKASLSEMADAVMPVLMELLNQFVPLLTAIMEVVAQVVAIIVEAAAQLLATVLPIITDLITILAEMGGQLLELILPIVQQVADFLAEMMPQIQELITTVMTEIQTVIETVWPIIQQVISVALDAIMAVMEAVWPAVQILVETAMTAIQDVINIVLAAINGDWESVWSGLQTLLEDVWSGIQDAVDVAMNAIGDLISQGLQWIVDNWGDEWQVVQDVVEPIWDAIQTLIDTAMTAIGDIITTIMDAIQGDWDAVWTDIQTLCEDVWNGIQSVVEDVFDAVSAFIEDVLSNIQSFWEEAWNTIQELCQEAWDQISSACETAINDVLNWFSELPGNILSALGDLGNLLFDAGCSIINGLLAGLQSAVGAVWDFVSGIAGTIASLKGPKAYDMRLLIPNGKWIMDSLNEGLSEGFKPVRRNLESMTREISMFDADMEMDIKASNKYSFDIPETNIGALVRAMDSDDRNLTKEDVYEAMHRAIDDSNGKSIELYIDGKKVADTIAGPMDAALSLRSRR